MSQAIRLFNSNKEPVYPCPYYPIGAIYMSVTNHNPSSIFGGTWERIKDKFLLCAGDSYSAGSTGGSVNHYHSTGNHTLTINQIPSHTHTYFRTRAIWAEPAADESTAVGCNNTWSYGKTYPETYAEPPKEKRHPRSRWRHKRGSFLCSGRFQYAVRSGGDRLLFQ